MLEASGNEDGESGELRKKEGLTKSLHKEHWTPDPYPTLYHQRATPSQPSKDVNVCFLSSSHGVGQR